MDAVLLAVDGEVLEQPAVVAEAVSPGVRIEVVAVIVDAVETRTLMFVFSFTALGRRFSDVVLWVLLFYVYDMVDILSQECNTSEMDCF